MIKKNNLQIICWLIALSTASPDVSASDWRLVRETAKSKSIMFIETSALDTEKNERSLWLAQVHKNVDSRGEKSNRFKVIANCSERIYLVTFFAAYREDGSSMTSLTPDKEWRPIIPGSTGENWFSLACSNKVNINKFKPVEDPVEFAEFLWNAIDHGANADIN